MHSNIILLNKDSIACDDNSEFLNIIDIFIYCPIDNIPLLYNQQFIDFLEPYTANDNIPLDDFFCEFTILESIFKSSRVTLDQSEIQNYLLRRGVPSEVVYLLDSRLHGLEGYYDFTGVFYKFRSYQEILGIGAALDIIEGTYHLLEKFKNYDNIDLPAYIIIQPVIMAFFPDACELLCLDFNYFTDVFFPLLRTFIFDFEALNINEVFLTLKQANESQIIISVFEVAGFLLKFDLDNHFCEPNAFYSINDCNLSIEFLEKNLLPELIKYHQVYSSFVNFINQSKYNENLHLIPSL